MNEQIRAWYLGLQDTSKQIFLALVSNSLTVHGRECGLDLSGETQIEAFKGLNEFQHQLSGHIAAIGLAGDRYPDEVLWAILHEKLPTIASCHIWLAPWNLPGHALAGASQADGLGLRLPRDHLCC